MRTRIYFNQECIPTVQVQVRGFSAVRTKVGTNNPIRYTEAAAAMAVDGDFVLFEILVPMWKWFTCVALAGGALDILLSQAMHGSDVHRTPYGALIKAWI
jgi:hypothetical protein